MPYPAHLITHDGETRPLEVWANLKRLAPATLRSRLFKFKWGVERALTTPVEKRFSRGGRKKKGAVRAAPELKRHRDGRAYCSYWLQGAQRFRSFGRWGSDEARAAYRRFQAEWAGAGTDAPSAGKALVGHVVLAWNAHCAATYRKRGRPTSEVHCNRAAMLPLSELYADLPASEFSPKCLRTLREAMAAKGWVRKTVNAQVRRVVRAFAWAATEGMAPAETHALLALVEPLAAGRRDDLAEGRGVPPAPPGHVEAVLKGAHLHPSPGRRAVLSAMIRVQLLTGMRPGELCALAAADLDRGKAPWRYEPREYNKMLHKERARPVFFGPRARKILAPFLKAALKEGGGLLFRLPPARTGAPATPLTPRSYRDFVQAACDRAKVARWAPNQLRHNRATEVMDRYEDDRAVGALLGNSPEVSRQVYAERAGEGVARRIAEATG